MKKAKRNLLPLLIIAVLAVIMIVYMRFFNGNLVYLTTGLTKNQICRVDNVVTDTMQANILLSDTKQEYEELFGDDVWNQSFDGISFSDYVKDKVKTKLLRVRCMNLMAEEKGVALSRSQKEDIESATDEFMAGLTDSEISDAGITRDKVVTMFTEFVTAQTLYDDIVSTLDCEVSSDDARVIKIQYICTDSESEIEEAKASLNDGESFYVVANQYDSEDGSEYELKRGEMVKEFEDVAFNLKTGETSDIVKADDKYYIIKCTSDNQKSKTESNKAALLVEKQLAGFNSIFESYEATKYTEFNDSVWNKTDLKNVDSLSVRFETIFKTYFQS